MIPRKILLLGVAGFAIGLAAALAPRLMPMSGHQHHTAANSPAAAVKLFEMPLRGTGEPRVTLAALAEGGPLLVNFWATWCAPCLREIPLLQQAEQTHRVKTVGISYEELPLIEGFSERTGVAYPLYKSSFDIFYFMQQQGNRAAVLPYTVLLDATGAVVREKIGDFKTAEEIVAFAQIPRGEQRGEQKEEIN